MSEDLIPAYVRASAALLHIPLDEARAMRVAEHLTRTAAMAELLDATSLAMEDEPVALYCPAPFPDGEDTQ